MPKYFILYMAGGLLCETQLEASTETHARVKFRTIYNVDIVRIRKGLAFSAAEKKKAREKLKY